MGVSRAAEGAQRSKRFRKLLLCVFQSAALKQLCDSTVFFHCISIMVEYSLLIQRPYLTPAHLLNLLLVDWLDPLPCCYTHIPIRIT